MDFETISLILKSIVALSNVGIAVVLIKYVYDDRKRNKPNYISKSDKRKV